MRLTSLAALMALIIGCSPQPAAQAVSTDSSASTVGGPAAALHPVSGLQVIDLTVTSGDRTHSFKVELANTDEAQARGLMFRTELGPDEGMLFPSATPTVRSFWMKNTPLPLDIIFIGVDGRISNIAANTVPYSLESVASQGLASAVLELAGGRAAELGITAGNAVEYSLPE